MLIKIFKDEASNLNESKGKAAYGRFKRGKRELGVDGIIL